MYTVLYSVSLTFLISHTDHHYLPLFIHLYLMTSVTIIYYFQHAILLQIVNEVGVIIAT